MPNIGIYVSDALAGRLARLRDLGTPVNVSQTCQMALERAVEASENGPDAGRKARMVERLGQSRNPEERAFHLGERAGREWAESMAAWTDVVRVANWGRIGPGPFGIGVYVDGRLLQQMEGFPNDTDALVNAGLYPGVKEAQVQYFRGFHAGVVRMYELVHDDLGSGAP